MRNVLPFITAIVVGLCAGAACAEDAKIDSMLEKAMAKVAKEHAKVGKWADKNDLYRYGYLEYSNCVEFNPDDKHARKRLGFEKTSTGSWVRSRDIEVKKIDEIDEDDRVVWEDQYDGKRITTKKKALKEFEKVLEAAVKAGYEPAKLESAKLIRRYDPFHPGALAALGMELDEHGRPVEPELAKDAEGNVEDEAPAAGPTDDDAPGRGAIRNIDLKPVGGADRPHPWAGQSGLPIGGSESRHHCILSTEMTDEERAALGEIAEQMRARFYKRYRVPNDVEFYTRKMALLYLADREEHKRFVNTVYAANATDERDLDFTLNHAGGGTIAKHFAAWDTGGGEATERDFCCHYGTHLLTNSLNPGLPTWMNEAVAYEQSIGVLGTSWTSCINDVTTGDRAKKWGDPVNWRELIRDLVRLEEDTPFSTIIGLKANDIDPKIAAKCWSFLTWLLETDGDKVWNILGTLWGDEAQQNAAFVGVFGKDLPTLEKEWQRYVKDNY